MRSVEEALHNRELLKARVLDGAPDDVRTTASQLAEQLTDVEIPMTTGRTVVLYRPFPDDPEIKLP